MIQLIHFQKDSISCWCLADIKYVRMMCFAGMSSEIKPWHLDLVLTYLCDHS